MSLVKLMQNSFSEARNVEVQKLKTEMTTFEDLVIDLTPAFAKAFYRSCLFSVSSTCHSFCSELIKSG